MCLFWATGYLAQNAVDFSFITGFFAVVISTVILLLVYRWTNNRNLLYILLIYAFTLIAAYQDASLFFSFLMVASFLVSLVAFLDLFVASSHHIKLGSLLGSVYALCSLLFAALSFAHIPVPVIVWSIPNFIFAASIFMIYLDGKYCMLLHPKPFVNLHHRKAILHVVFLRYLFYTISITGLLFISAISIHELGHAITSNYYGCEQARIVFDLKSFPHTEISCQNFSAGSFAITIAGVAATSIAGLFLWLTGEKFSVKLGHLMFGYGFLIGYQDFIDLGINSNIVATVTLLTLIAIVASFYEISRYYIDSQRELFAPPAPEIEKGTRQKGNHQKAVTNVFIHTR